MTSSDLHRGYVNTDFMYTYSTVMTNKRMSYYIVMEVFKYDSFLPAQFSLP